MQKGELKGLVAIRIEELVNFYGSRHYTFACAGENWEFLSTNHAAACALFWTLSFANICRRYIFTLASVSSHVVAILLLESPWAPSATISFSSSLSMAGCSVDPDSSSVAEIGKR